jgi:hypothetical protein
MMENADPMLPGNWETDQELSDFFHSVHNTVQHVYRFRVVLAMFQFLIGGRLFKAFDAQPRLALVTRTISRAGVTLVHFMVVWLSVFFVFIISAVVLFGQEIKYFANISRASHTTFRILLGDFDWEEVHAVGRAQAYIWFWLLQWGLNLVMLNMLLGIILDTYAEVKSEILNQPGVETLWSQVIEIYIRTTRVMRQQWISLPLILKTLDPTDLTSDDEDVPDPLLTVDDFVNMVPKLNEDQAKEILMTCYEFYGDGEDVVEETNEQVLVREVGHIRVAIDEVLKMQKSGSLSRSLSPKIRGADTVGC